MTKLSVVIPAWNEEDGIEDIVLRVLAVKEQLLDIGVGDLEVMVVDDGSSDRTSEVAGGIAGLRLIRHPQNRGYGAALKTGFSAATGDLIGFLDADGTYPPEFFPQLCLPALDGQELVIGSRMAGERSEMPITRRIGNMFFAALLSVLGRQKVTDSASGMRVFKRDILDRISPLPDGLNLTPVMSTRALHEGISVTEVPISYSERVGRSKLSVVRDGSIFLRSMFWTVLTYNPVRILGLLGLGGVGLAGLVGLGLLGARMSGVTTLGPWGVGALYGALVSGVTGVSLFTLGATFNYLVSLFYQRPIRQGLFGRPIFTTPLEYRFGWLGAVCLLAGFGLGAASLVLGYRGWGIERLWLYLLGSSILFLMGIQLIVSWLVVRVLGELSARSLSSASGPAK